ncbi:MAG: hypothetical protein MJZ59_02505 [Paludibacteraceae bacterium]|nr:hypothetical protein [Paludibacteraceae bacterium]
MFNQLPAVLLAWTNYAPRQSTSTSSSTSISLRLRLRLRQSVCVYVYVNQSTSSSTSTSIRLRTKHAGKCFVLRGAVGCLYNPAYPHLTTAYNLLSQR